MADESTQQMADEIRRALGGALQQVGNDLAKLDRVSKDAVGLSGGIGRLDGTFMSMAGRLLGPIGLVAGLQQVSNALSNVATQSVQMQAFSRNTGLATNSIKNMQLQLQMMGKTSEEAKATISGLAGSLNDFTTNREGSSLYQTLIGREGGAAVIRDLQAAKNVTEQIAVILKTYQAQPNERQRRGVAEAFGMDPASIEELIKNQNLVALTFKTNEEAMKKYHAASVIFETNINAMWKAVAGNAIAGLNEITGAAEGNTELLKSIVDGTNAFVNEGLARVKTTIEEFKAIKNSIESMMGEDRAKGKEGARNLLGSSPIGSWADLTPYELLSGTRYEYPQAEDPYGADYSAPSTANQFGKRTVPRLRERSDGAGVNGITDFGGMRRTQALEEEQTNAAIETRDILKRMEEKGGGSPATSEGGGPGGAAYGKGIRGDGEGPMKAGTGGFRPSSGETRADRNNNPGNIEYGAFAKRMGATGSDGRFAIFPDRETGFKAAETLLGGKGYEGKTLAEIGKRWADGDTRWAHNVSKATGIPVDAVPTAEQRSQIARVGIPRAEGSGYRPGPNSPGYIGGSGDGLPSAVLDEARKVAASGGSEAVQSYIRSQGYQVNSAWCGDFAAAVVRGAGGTPPKGHSIASNWRNFGTQVDDPQPGDIAVRKTSRFGGRGYVPTGGTGSHVTVVDSVNGRNFIGLGGNQSRRRAPFSTGDFEYFRGSNPEEQAARARMDKAKNAGTENSLKATIDFNNVPPGVKTNVESEGEIFKQLQVNKSRQGQPAGGSPGEPFAGVW